jgi:hypothetical protein
MSAPPVIDLGPYREQLRQFLSGRTEFPANCILSVVLSKCETGFAQAMWAPFPLSTQGFCAYSLLFLGISFNLYVGRQIPGDLRQADFVRGPGNPLLVTPHLQDWLRINLSLMIKDNDRALSMLRRIEPH